MTLTPRFASRWLCHQWPAWCEALEAQGVPASGLLRSVRSQKARGSQDAPSTAEFYSASTAALLCLMVRWASTLKAGAKEKAVAVLTAFLATALPTSWRWPAVPGAPAQKAYTVDTNERKVDINFVAGVADLEPLMRVAPDMRKGGARSLLAPLSFPASPPTASVQEQNTPKPAFPFIHGSDQGVSHA